MILEKLLSSQELKSIIKEFISINKEIWDIGIYGSVVRGKIDISDIDIIIILKNNLDLNKKLELSQKLKSKIKKIINFDMDIKCIDINDFTDNDFLARNGIIAESFLFNHKIYLAEIFGFKSFYIFEYNLSGLKKSEKQMFLYALNGRGGNKGLLQIMDIRHIGRGVIQVPLKYAEAVKEFLEKNHIKSKIKRALIY